MPTLLDISEDVRALQAALDEEAGELTPALEDWFAKVQADLEGKTDNYCALIREFELRAAVRKEESDRLQKRIAADMGLARRLKARLQSFMEETGTPKIETPRYRVSVAGNGGKEPLEINAPPEDLPPDCQRVTVEADTDALREYLKAGQEIPGVKLLPRGKHLRIS